MKPYRIAPPAEMPVSLSDIKSYTRIDFADDDAVLGALTAAAVDHLDGFHGVLGRCIVSQEWGVRVPSWELCLKLPFPDVSAASITYVDELGISQAVPPADYEVLQAHGHSMIRFNRSYVFPSLSCEIYEPISIAFTAGFGDASDVPAAIKLAISRLVAHWNLDREAVGDAALMPMAYWALIAPFRMVMP